ncbi:hypothetical protein LEP1GSC041_2848 [Leptospira noguchii str. 2006001870]|nr:hypothetical protein LEP1GSC041_2848 [Leptospira noguchii str. 2006001870]
MNRRVPPAGTGGKPIPHRRGVEPGKKSNAIGEAIYSPQAWG